MPARRSVVAENRIPGRIDHDRGHVAQANVENRNGRRRPHIETGRIVSTEGRDHEDGPGG